MRLIDADHLKKWIINRCLQYPLKTIDILDQIDRELTYKAMIDIVRCKDCIHRPIDTGRDNDPEDLEFPDDRCPCRCTDYFYSWMPEDDWFCANGE